MKTLVKILAAATLLLPSTSVFAQKQTPYMQLLTGDGQARMPMGAKSQHKYVAPGQLFQVEIPPEWGVTANAEDPDNVTFMPKNSNFRVFIAVRRLPVPPGAAAMQIALQAKEQRLQLLPLWQEQSTRKVVVAGRPAVVVTGNYYFQGNREYPIILEELIVALENEAFIIHFESFTGAAASFGPILEKFYATFQPHPAPEQIQQQPEHQRNPLLDLPY